MGKRKGETERDREGEDRVCVFYRALRPDAFKSFTRICIFFDPETLPLGIYTEETVLDIHKDLAMFHCYL